MLATLLPQSTEHHSGDQATTTSAGTEIKWGKGQVIGEEIVKKLASGHPNLPPISEFETKSESSDKS